MESETKFLSNLRFHIELGHNIVIYGIGNMDKMIKTDNQLVDMFGEDVRVIKFVDFLSEMNEDADYGKRGSLKCRHSKKDYFNEIFDIELSNKPVIILKDGEALLLEEPQTITKFFGFYKDKQIVVVVKNIRELEHSFFIRDNFVFLNNNIFDSQKGTTKLIKNENATNERIENTDDRDILAGILSCFPKCYIDILKTLVNRFKNEDFDLQPNKFYVQKSFTEFKRKLIIKNKQEYISILKEFNDQQLILLSNEDKEFKLKKSKKFIQNEFADLLTDNNFLKDIEDFYGI